VLLKSSTLELRFHHCTAVDEFVAVGASRFHTFQQVSTIIGFPVAEFKGLSNGDPLVPNQIPKAIEIE
jgi:hypothetical protein